MHLTFLKAAESGERFQMKMNFVLSFILGTVASFYLATAFSTFSLWICTAFPLVVTGACVGSSAIYGQWKEGRQFAVAGLGVALGSAFGLYVVPLFHLPR